ncbi:hypothetical protein, partial [Novipirellula aureliae]
LSLTILPGMSTRTTTRVTPETFEELVRLQQSVGDLQGELNRGRDQLEEDRRQWDQRERRAPIIAAAIQTGGILFACLLPIVAVVILLWPRATETADAEIVDTILIDAASEQPRLLPQPNPPESPEPVRLE